MRMRIVLSIIIGVVVFGGIGLYLHNNLKENITDISTLDKESIKSLEQQSISDKPITDNKNPTTDTRSDVEVNNKTFKSKKGTPDWANDEKNTTRLQSDDVWKDFGIPDGMIADENLDEDFDITDPASYESLRKSMIKTYGDTSEVEDYMQTWLGVVSDPNSIRAKAEFAKAVYAIFPHPQTLKTMNVFNAMANNDDEALAKYLRPANSDRQEPFSDVQHFFKGNSRAEGFRRLRESNPKRSAEFEEFILGIAKRDHSISLEEVENAIAKSYELDKD